MQQYIISINSVGAVVGLLVEIKLEQLIVENLSCGRMLAINFL